VVPILVVVAWLFAFMHLAGYGINIVTATIGAVSIGIGIDFAIHFIMRYREELERLSDRLEAVDAAGAGTGAALAASALSSVVGFAIMAFAPMPMFSVYGLLTAIMIVMALIATLAVLPGLLVLVTTAKHIPVSPRPLETATAKRPGV
jgi:predicted RND superfamily exporter protein